MAIEPLVSAMSYTVQPTVRPAEAQSGTSETREGQPVEANAPQVDAETISLAKAQTEDEGGKKDEGGRNSSGQKQGPMNDDAIKEALKELAKKETNVQSEFGIHEKTNRITVKLVDKQTKEVIKELPPEKMLDMIAKVWEYAGLIVDEKR